MKMVILLNSETHYSISDKANSALIPTGYALSFGFSFFFFGGVLFKEKNIYETHHQQS